MWEEHQHDQRIEMWVGFQKDIQSNSRFKRFKMSTKIICFEHYFVLFLLFYIQSPARLQQQKKYNIKELRRARKELTQDQKEKHKNHREEFHKSREPMLNGLTSQYDLDLFREAQNRASEEMVGVSYFFLMILLLINRVGILAHLHVIDPLFCL